MLHQAAYRGRTRGARRLKVCRGCTRCLQHTACCEGDIHDVIEGAQWAIENKDSKGIDILTSSLANSNLRYILTMMAHLHESQMMQSQHLELSLSISRNEFGGATLAGCNTIDSPGDANLLSQLLVWTKIWAFLLFKQGLHI